MTVPVAVEVPPIAGSARPCASVGPGRLLGLAYGPGHRTVRRPTGTPERAKGSSEQPFGHPKGPLTEWSERTREGATGSVTRGPTDPSTTTRPSRAPEGRHGGGGGCPSNRSPSRFVRARI